MSHTEQPTRCERSQAAQRIGGFLAAGACLAGAVWGGWTVGSALSD